MSLLAGLRDAAPPVRRQQPPAPAVRDARAAVIGTSLAGLSFGAVGADQPVFDFGAAMAAPAYFPWLQVGVSKAARFLAGLPLRHAVTGEIFTGAQDRDRLQWSNSALLCREAWAVPPDADGFRYAHPATGWVEDGVARGVLSADGRKIPQPVTWYRGETYSRRPNHRGTSPILSLAKVLQTEASVDRHSAVAASRGMPTAVLSPKTDDGVLTESTRDTIVGDLERQRQQGIDWMVVPNAIKVDTLGISARDQEFSEVVARAQSAALAAMNVPPTMAGLPSANYGTARAEERAFAEHYFAVCGKHDPSAGLNAFYSAIFGVPLVHDFRDVAALRAMFADMTETATKLTGLGLSPRKAMEVAGFPEYAYRHASDDAPAPSRPPGRPEKPAEAEEPRERLARALRESADRWADGVTDETSEAVCLATVLRSIGVPTGEAETRAARRARRMATACRLAAERGDDVRSIGAFAVGPDLAP